MLVQAAPGPNLQPPGEWRRRSVGGNAPTLLRVATWAIKMRDDEIENIALAIGKSILVVPVILFLWLGQLEEVQERPGQYTDF